MTKVTLQSIADQVGVSRMTVSNAFSKPDQLSAELRRTILDAAEELGYTGPDPAARALARGRTGSVGLLINDPLSTALSDALASDFVGALSDALVREGLALTVVAPPEHAGVAAVRDVAVDAAIVWVCGPSSDDVKVLLGRGVPIVTVDQEPISGRPAVRVDDRGAARAAARHLVELGHRRIAIVTLEDLELGVSDQVPSHPARERIRGWRDVLDEAGITPTVITGRYHAEPDLHRPLTGLLTGPNPPTAVLCFSDAFAVSVLQVAADAGIRVPEDLSVVGFDDTILARHSRPPLTTIHQDVVAKAQAAVDGVVAQLRPTSESTVDVTVVPTSLVVRESTARPPDAR
ncbi:MAG TPA: LacI family DNA-binding transcriptional regulator [Candidatus Nanopelagicales bacterium]|nr:LacI family DNA-binding transcriptional regulator [Candidatus Nanopelagicales bacterium]